MFCVFSHNARGESETLNSFHEETPAGWRHWSGCRRQKARKTWSPPRGRPEGVAAGDRCTSPGDAQGLLAEPRRALGSACTPLVTSDSLRLGGIVSAQNTTKVLSSLVGLKLCFQKH